ncbi:unnamed protein product [Ambrosiozyma monospora]|uniref:Unnamed protein product n=1 Tax=Ambrosiozyma monospora TaxID=43982 RepID=A0ACB5SY51_AMBMO|nr:unnamed protein product [Ambrosiozyma monospora]
MSFVFVQREFLFFSVAVVVAVVVAVDVNIFWKRLGLLQDSRGNCWLDIWWAIPRPGGGKQEWNAVQYIHM